MSKKAKYLSFCLLIILTSTMLLSLVSAQEPEFPPPPNLPPLPPETEEEAIVVVAAALGGTTDPPAGEYTYTFADTISLEAIPNSGYRFQKWVISGQYTPGHNIPPIVYPENIDLDDPTYVPNFPDASAIQSNSLVTSTNPLNVVCGYGYTFVYQPVFVPTSTVPAPTNNAIVVVVESVGGSTDPGPGTYYYAEDSTIVLTATPDDGYEFDSWVAVGEQGHPIQFTDNPTSIICGYGYEYEYQPMFRPTGTTTEEQIPLYIYAVIAVLAIIAVIGVGAAIMYRGKSK